jgi:hypothetical protein
VNKIYFTLSAAFILSFLGCQSTTDKSSSSKAQAFADQAALINLVRETEIADKDRSLVHLSHSCNMVIDNQIYAVLDMRELVKGATTARGINQIILLNSEHQLVNRIEYGQARPLFCENNKLYLYDTLIVNGQAEEGNVLQFTDAGFAVTVTNEDLNTKLPLTLY